MISAPADASENVIKHLVMVETVISRMAAESNAMKRYCLVVTAAVTSTAVATAEWYLALVSASLVVIFWGLDGQYLTLERQYRVLYEKIRVSKTKLDFNLSLSSEIRSEISLNDSVLSWSVAWLYGGLIALSLILACVIVT